MLNRLLTSLLGAFVLAGTAAAQEPPKPEDPKPVRTETGEQKRQDPEKRGTQTPPPAGSQGQESGKTGQDPAKGSGKAGDPKTEGKDPPKATEVDLPEGGPLPASSDPADIRAMQSAQDMLSAERRIRQLLKKGEIEGIDQVLTFEEISSWPYEDGLKGMPESLAKLDGKEVLMIGFMLPIDEVEDIKEFLLVQSLWACCYGQPPDINGIVRVVMKGDKRVDYQFDPIRVRGTFEVEATLEDGYCIDIFQLHASEVGLIDGR